MIKLNYVSITKDQKIFLFKSIGLMLKSGIPLLECIDSLKQDTTKSLNKILNDIYNGLHQGSTISEQLSKYPKVFDKVTISIIDSSEKSGSLSQSLIDISNDMQQEKDFTSKIKSSLAYPLFVILLSISIFSVILFYVIPKITAVFTKLNVTLPLATTILISISDFFITYLNYILLISAFLLISLLFTYIFNNKLLVDVFFRLPFVSKIALKLDLIKVNKNLHKLLNAGITIDKALLLTQEICYSKYSKDLISNCLINLEKGMQVSQSLKNDKKLFKSIHIKIIESGEKSGTLKEAFLDISVISKEDLDYTLKNITTLIEPILITFLGIFVGSIIVSIIAPIYQLISNIGG